MSAVALRRSSVMLLVLGAACAKPEEKPAATADSTAAMAAPAAAPAPAAPAGPRTVVTVIYQWPGDTTKFESYYKGTHLPLVAAGKAEIGFEKAEFTKFVSSLDGKKPAFYRQAELYFASLDAAKKGMATPAFKKVADDLGNFDTKGLIGLVGTETAPGSEAEGGALVTVIYQVPADTAKWESYYNATHSPLVSKGQAEVGFARADFTRFQSGLDFTSAPAKYRQAELYFSDVDAVKKGMATAAFKTIAGDLGNFDTKGLVGMIGVVDPK